MRSKKAIGSFFESAPELLLRHSTTPPWEQGGSVKYVQTGRQALKIVAHLLESEGRDTLLVPDFLCASMISEFDPAHWILKKFTLDADLQVDVTDLAAQVGRIDPQRTAVMTIAYFGAEPSKKHLQSVEWLQAHGIRVIEDETHRVLGSLTTVGDFGIASLRKVLPVADGAYIRGVTHLPPLAERDHTGWDAADLKLRGDISGAKAAFGSATQVLEKHGQAPARMSDRTLTTIQHLDYEKLRAKRRANASVLRNELRNIPNVSVLTQGPVPSHLVISTLTPKSLQSKLAANNIFCPIHWPQPNRMSDVVWRNNLLSLPIDHRYDTADMTRLAQTLKTEVER